MSICGFVECENRVKEIETLNEKIKELNEIDGGFRNEIKELKLKNDLLKSNYDELMIEYKFYENLILDALKENNLLQDNGTKIAQS